MRITFVISSLSSGGAERVMTLIANYWSGHGKNVTLITYAQAGADFYELNPEIKRINILIPPNGVGIFSSISGNMRRICNLRSALTESRPDVIISFMDTVNVLTLMASLGLGIPRIISERIDPRFHSTKTFWRILRKIFYPTASALVIQTNNLRQWAESIVGKRKTFVISNPVSVKYVPENVEQPSFPSPYILAMGRLEYQKGFDLLIDAFSRVVRKFPGWNLVILGEGSQRKALSEKIIKNGMKNIVHLPGNISNNSQVISDSSFFVLSSRFEGFPNVLLESMALGKPVISFDCPSGPGEIIKDGVNGLLINEISVDGLETGLSRLIENDELRLALGSRASEVLETYSLERIVSQWDELLINVGVKT